MNNKKDYDILLYQLIYYKNRVNNIQLSKDTIKKDELREYFLKNVTKSTFLTQILPSILFLVISLISLSLVVLKRNNPKFQVQWFSDDLIIPILVFSVFWMILGVCLLTQNLIFKVKVINLQFIHKKGYHNISKNKYQEIIKLLS